MELSKIVPKDMGNQVSEKVSKRVVLIVLSVVLSVSLLEYTEVDNSRTRGFDQLIALNTTEGSIFQRALEEFQSQFG